MKRLTIVNARLENQPGLHSLLIEDGRFVSALSGPADTLDMQGALVLPGLVETHIHLDKACIIDRCNQQEGTLAEAISETARAKADFSEQDVYQRGARVLEMAIMQGTTHMRTHIEIDPVIGLTGFRAIRRLQAAYAWAIDLQLCVFPQEGMLNNPGTEALLCEALASGADLLGGCPYTDSDPVGQIKRLFALAAHHGVDLDFHLDFDLAPENRLIDEVIVQTRRWQLGGRVTVGHVTKLAILELDALRALGAELASAGVRVTALPATDLFLTARDRFALKPRGVAPVDELDRLGVVCSLSTNNIANPFTPFGDASLVRQANLFANVRQLGTQADLLRCLSWISSQSARLLRLSHYGLTPGCQADFVVFDVERADQVVAEIAPPKMGFKRGRQTFNRPPARLLR
ncbi:MULTISPECIES: amidohydrolase family protein [unclassified Brenneria]|uniref:amidohydrolase family protein n=1 Tax=unclassified Brenneria TaxID=2634434 RepID=UPI001551934E|nr:MULTISPECIES: amidohydrolase family protein [unclassified Brenneria]MBJ7223960.1 amidohydrolase family protein [Brenneria sp. L3-3C-1]MEE3645204.1 amidohydrolase family protein [Brenneria sp. L3_3C_1]MEE3649913.1 amidohydrolase family protein [Brenneria sp. HEZEL_4_2_4]NPC99871.1 amidohydrolase family protein [Brenneria sp. hezel4-2-4]